STGCERNSARGNHVLVGVAHRFKRLLIVAADSDDLAGRDCGNHDSDRGPRDAGILPMTCLVAVAAHSVRPRRRESQLWATEKEFVVPARALDTVGSCKSAGSRTRPEPE